MLIEKDIATALMMGTLFFLVLLASIAIPVFGYRRKQWKGLILGLLLLPVVCIVAYCLLFGSVVAYELLSIEKQRDSAMVTVRSTEPGTLGTDTLTWYVKADEECFMEHLFLMKTDETSSDSIEIKQKRGWFDVILLDSLPTSVSVEDRIVVRFDLKNQKATATDYDGPAEILNVDWEKVQAYFKKREPAL